MCSIYSQYKKMYNRKYTSEVFKSFRQHIKRAKYSSELIIENGFRIFGIIKQYQNFIGAELEHNEFLLDLIIQITKTEISDDTERNIFLEAIKFFSAHSGNKKKFVILVYMNVLK